MSACPRCGGLVVHAKDCETETVKALKQQANTSYARGVADERARVVADLVKSADKTSDDKVGPVKIVLLNAAVRIERGEHEESIPGVLIFGFPPVNP